MTTRPCGTAAAWSRHRRRREDPCGACVQAKCDEVSIYRRARARLRDLHRNEWAVLCAAEENTAKGYGRALTALTLNHPDEYRALVARIRGA